MTTAVAVPGTMSQTALAEHRENVYSQFGEDGIIEEILRRLGLWEQAPGSLFCVEFGAWDGKHLSNTRRLIEERGARAILIEGDKARARELEENCRAFAGVRPIHRMITWSGAHSLFRTLQEADCVERPDLLSIDVDGHDYWIWSSLRDYQATIVVIEYNPTIPYKHVYVPPYDPGERHGCSLAAVIELADSKGYELAAVTEVNAIFVKRERFADLGLADCSIERLTQGLPDYRTFLIQTSCGELVPLGNVTLMWHQSVIDRQSLQVLPRWLRRHPEEFGPLARWVMHWRRRRFRRRFDAQFEAFDVADQK